MITKIKCTNIELKDSCATLLREFYYLVAEDRDKICDPKQGSTMIPYIHYTLFKAYFVRPIRKYIYIYI